jgi:hypothetical protein
MDRYCPVFLMALVIAGLTELQYGSYGRAQSRQQPQAAKEVTNPKPQARENKTFALEGTDLLKRLVTEDIREEQRQQIIRYFTKQIAATPAKRDNLWQPSFSSLDAYKVSVQEHRSRWRTMLTDTTRFGSSYWGLPDEDFYNWNVLNRFAHTELVAAMWPRPVCVEYGSEDPRHNSRMAQASLEGSEGVH